MNVKKIFVVLITVVVCVILGAFVINILMPNATTSLIDTVENQIYNAVGMSFDLNGNGNGAGIKGNATMKDSSNDKSSTDNTSNTVNGFTTAN